MIEELKAWRAQHPAKPLPRDMEEALVAEVERLREQRHDDGKGRRVDAYLAGALDERAAVVAWLLKRAENSYAVGTVPGTIGYEARMILEAIERGEHRREEEP